MLNGLDLFSGIGGLTIALEPWVRPVVYCECDRYAQAVLLSRMAKSELPYAPIWDDVRTLRARDIPGVDIIYGGFPCQDISAAGLGVGLGGERSGLFQHIARLVQETNPRFIFLENVPAIRTRGLNSIVQTFTELGYDCRWTIVSAAEVGAPHLRKRWFLLAYTNGERGRLQQGRRKREGRKDQADVKLYGARQSLAYTTSLSERKQSNKAMSGADSWQTWQDFGRRGWWDTEPDVGRVVNGVPLKLDRDINVCRRTSLGNAVVPLQAREAFMRLIGITPTPEAAE